MGLRTEKLGAQIKRDLAPILQRLQNGTIITITGVRVTEDLYTAKVYLSIFAPGGDTKPTFDRIQEKNTEIRTELAALIRHQVRRVPEILFYLDDTAEYVNRIEELFKKIHKDDPT